MIRDKFKLKPSNDELLDKNQFQLSVELFQTVIDPMSDPIIPFPRPRLTRVRCYSMGLTFNSGRPGLHVDLAERIISCLNS